MRSSLWKSLVIASAIIIISLFWGGIASAQSSGTCGTSLNWVLDDEGTLTISGTGNMTNYTYSSSRPWRSVEKVIIRNGVTSIGNCAFYGCSNLTSVIIGNDVKSIGDSAFESCSGLDQISLPQSVTSLGQYSLAETSLSSLTIPSGLTNLGKGTFSHCKELISVSIPNTVTVINDNTFRFCEHLETVSLPNNLKSIGSYAFYDCVSLESVIIPSKVTSIGQNAFSSCTSLTSMIIPSSVQTISGNAFAYCTSLTSITIPSSLTSLGSSIFYDCTSLTDVYIEEGFTQIASSMFEHCTSLVSITLPNSLNSIGGRAFYSCTNLASIIIPDNVLSIGYAAFYHCETLPEITIPTNVIDIGENITQGCTELTRIVVSSNNTKYSSIDGVLLSKNGQTLIEYPAGKNGAYTIPNNVTMIASRAFINCTGLSSIVIPEGIVSIGDNAFEGANNLTEVYMSDSVTSIGISAFSGCTSLSSITISNSVSCINTNTFYRCESLSSIVIPETVVSIYPGAFSQCRRLSSITLPNNVTFEDGMDGESYIFSGCSSLLSIEIPDSVTKIGYGAFSNCTSLISVSIPDSVVSINDYAFSGCNSIVVTANQDSYAARRMSRLGYDFHLPNTHYDMRYQYNGDVITGLTLTRVDKEVLSFDIPEDITTIGDNAFSDCTSLFNVTIPNGVTSIGDSAFANCISLTTITIPDSVTSIGNSFGGCSALTSVCIVSTNTVFGANVFSNQPTIYCYEYSDADFWAEDMGYVTIYLDDANLGSIRTVALPNDLYLERGISQAIAINVFPHYDNPRITWTSSDSNILTVMDGIVTTLAPGKATITATVNDVSASMEITVYIAVDSFMLNETECWMLSKTALQLLVKDVYPEEAEPYITWICSDTACAVVDSTGLVNARKPGDATITALSNNGISRTCLVHVCYPVSAVTFESEALSVKKGATVQLIANVTMNSQSCVNHLVSFTSDDEAVATVDGNGLVTTHSVGTAIITATAASGFSDSCSITVREWNLLVLPSTLLRIESGAFTGLPEVEGVRIPDTVTSIADDAFDNSIVIFASAGSYAESWALEHGFRVLEEIDN